MKGAATEFLALGQPPKPAIFHWTQTSRPLTHVPLSIERLKMCTVDCKHCMLFELWCHLVWYKFILFNLTLIRSITVCLFQRCPLPINVWEQPLIRNGITEVVTYAFCVIPLPSSKTKQSLGLPGKWLIPEESYFRMKGHLKHQQSLDSMLQPQTVAQNVFDKRSPVEHGSNVPHINAQSIMPWR